MAIHIPSLQPAAVALEIAQPSAGTGRSNLATRFRALLDELQTQHRDRTASASSGGVAAAGAVSANARSAATAAATSAMTAANATVAATNATAAAGSKAMAPAASATPTANPAIAATSDPNAVLTPEQVFGANPWVANPTGIAPNGFVFGYNPLYFATASTAAEVAQMVGGKVVEDDEFTKDTPGDTFIQQQPNEMVELPDGALVNPGLIASFYTHGYPNSLVNQSISNEVNGAEAAVASIGT